jgi:hypothetical protein
MIPNRIALDAQAGPLEKKKADVFRNPPSNYYRSDLLSHTPFPMQRLCLQLGAARLAGGFADGRYGKLRALKVADGKEKRPTSFDVGL